MYLTKYNIGFSIQVIDIMENDLEKIVRDLAEVYDEDSKNSYVSVYFNKNGDKSFLEKRVNVCSSLLDRSEKDNFLLTIKKINEFLKGKKDKNYAIFASKKYDFFKSITLSIDIYNALIVDSSPYIRPLVRIMDEWESFIIVVINSNKSKIFSI